ncbi:MAG: helix-turn-helix domain-containing protein [Promethearchaeota archaeon]
MLERIELLYQARNIFRESGYILNEHPYRSASFDFVARRNRVFIVKVILNLESVAGQHAIELLLIAEMLKATPIVLGVRSNNSNISDGVIYERHGVLALNLHTLRDLLLEDQIPTARAKRGGHYINISHTKLRKLRIKKALSLRDVARTLNLSVKTIRSYESGDAIPTAENALRLRKLLGDEVIQPIALFKKPEKKSLPRNKQTPKTELQRNVQEQLVELDVEVVWFDFAPMDAICHTKASVELESEHKPTMITGVAHSICGETMKRMNDAVTIGLITNNKAFFIIQNEMKHKELIPPLPTLQLDHLEQLNDQEELMQIIRQYRRSYA